MGRKNSNAVKRRLKSPGRSRGYSTPAALKSPSRRPHCPLTDIIIPTGKCGRKLRFGTEREAAAALREARKSPKNPKYVEQRYYLCPRCDGYHLTSMEGRMTNVTVR